MAHNDSAARHVDVGVSAKSLAGIRGVAASNFQQNAVRGCLFRLK